MPLQHCAESTYHNPKVDHIQKVLSGEVLLLFCYSNTMSMVKILNYIVTPLVRQDYN